MIVAFLCYLHLYLYMRITVILSDVADARLIWTFPVRIDLTLLRLNIFNKLSHHELWKGTLYSQRDVKQKSR